MAPKGVSDPDVEDRSLLQAECPIMSNVTGHLGKFWHIFDVFQEAPSNVLKVLMQGNRGRKAPLKSMLWYTISYIASFLNGQILPSSYFV